MGKSNRILAIKNISIETLGNFKPLFHNDGYVVDEVLAPEQPIPANALDSDAIFILGGPMSANDNHEYLIKEKQLIKQALDNEVLIVGICLGSQLIAETCGGRVYPGPKKEIGWGFVDLTKSGKKDLFKNIGNDGVDVFHWHGDTFDLPVQAEVMARSDLYKQAFKYKTAYGMQFHLEVTENMIFNWIKYYKKELILEKISEDEILFDIKKRVLSLANLSKSVYQNFISVIR
ncbi:MAG: type 1 glutamine amidotransferase [Thermoproteota archaeon]|nr:type 1 glutamine amidotransferase [Thermoproteota archaeon]